MKVMFVCMGNICRSPLAHAVLEDKIARSGDRELRRRIEVESSGTIAYHVGEPADARMTRTAARHDVVIDHAARHFTRELLESYDLIIAMDHDNLRAIEKIGEGLHGALDKVHLLREFEPDGPADEPVPDPYYGGQSGFENVYRIVERCTATLLDRLRESPNTLPPRTSQR